jgi:hypothetical protein
MEQVYWLSTPLEAGTDTRMLLYRYGNFVYAGAVITEPVKGLEYLPGVLQGIQAVQGQIPYLCEYRDVPADSPHRHSLRALEAVIDTVHAEISAAEGKLAALAEGGAAWLAEDDASVYFEFAARAGFTCNVRARPRLGRGGGGGGQVRGRHYRGCSDTAARPNI